MLFRSGALPEVVGDAALQVDPRRVEAITTALRRLEEEPGLVNELSRRGPARAAGFRWEQAANQVSEVLWQCAS